MHQVIVRELKILLARLSLRNRFIFGILAFGIGRRDEADFAVQNTDQIIKSFGPIA